MDSLVEKEREEFIQTVIGMTKDLVQIDSEQCKDIISRLTMQHMHQAIKILGPHPDLQKQLLKKVIDSRDKGVRVEMSLMLQNIELLCQIDKKQVLPELENNQDYPLDECFRICKQYQVKEAMAYLMERLGGVQEALDLHLAIILGKVTGHLAHPPGYQKDEFAFLPLAIQPALKLCASLKKQDEE